MVIERAQKEGVAALAVHHVYVVSSSGLSQAVPCDDCLLQEEAIGRDIVQNGMAGSLMSGTGTDARQKRRCS